jgi:hypothetical protein
VAGVAVVKVMNAVNLLPVVAYFSPLQFVAGTSLPVVQEPSEESR